MNTVELAERHDVLSHGTGNTVGSPEHREPDGA
jgi:hypothetical protein